LRGSICAQEFFSANSSKRIVDRTCILIYKVPPPLLVQIQQPLYRALCRVNDTHTLIHLISSQKCSITHIIRPNPKRKHRLVALLQRGSSSISSFDGRSKLWQLRLRNGLERARRKKVGAYGAGDGEVEYGEVRVRTNVYRPGSAAIADGNRCGVGVTEGYDVFERIGEGGDWFCGRGWRAGCLCDPY
jgi:hypothetical protein